jgi:hypothetical protein
MTAKRRHRARLSVAGAFVALVGIGAMSIAFNGRTTSSDGLLPPLPKEEAPPHEAASRQAAMRKYKESDFGAQAPGAATLAGPAASAVRRFAGDWANRNSVLTPAIKREMVGLSAGAWANAVFLQARLTLPAIEGVRSEGRFVMMKLSSVAPRSKTALVVTQERLRGPGGDASSPRYELYLARLDRVTPRGYAITAWEPQQ